MWVPLQGICVQTKIVTQLAFPYYGHDMIFWIFAFVSCHAFCKWHWPIGKDLDLNFIWGYHHLNLKGYGWSVDQLITTLLATPCWQDPTRSKQPITVEILGFQFGRLYHVFHLAFLPGMNRPQLIVKGYKIAASLSIRHYTLDTKLNDLP